MDNYNIELKAEDFPGARVSDVTIGGVTKKCLCIPIDNYIGCCADGYMNGLGEFKTFSSVKIRLSAYSMRQPKYEDTHYIIPNVSKDAFQRMDDSQRQRYEKIVGHMRPWREMENPKRNQQRNSRSSDGWDD